MGPHSSRLMDHFDNPRNAGPLADPTSIGRADRRGKSPRLAIHVQIEDRVVVATGFEAFGCGVAIACCSRLTEKMIGLSIDECLHLDSRGLIKDFGGVPHGKDFCANMAIQAMRNAFANLTSPEHK